MQTIYGRNMHEAIPQALGLLSSEGDPNGDMTELTNPVTIMVTKPTERLSYGMSYDLSPFVALSTALWVLGGRNDVEFLSKFDGYQMGMSDDGKVLHGAYGKRLRGHFQPAPEGEETFPIHSIDQLKSVVMMLRNNPAHTAVVISLWDAGSDMGLLSRNLPAATHLYLSITHAKRLDMMVLYRDADIFDLRLDALVFSMVQEYVAKAIAVVPGRMTLVANCLGAKTKALDLNKDLPLPHNPYRMDVSPWPLVSIDSDEWLGELSLFLDEGPVMGMQEPFFRHVAAPMWQAWEAYKSTVALDVDGARKALDIVSRIRATDWQAATAEWLLRRIDERT